MSRLPRPIAAAGPRRRRVRTGRVALLAIAAVIGGLLTAAIGAGLRMDDAATVGTIAPADGTEAWAGGSTARAADERPMPSADPSVATMSESVTPTAGRAGEPAPATRWFNGRPIRPVRTLAMKVTAYSPDERSCAPFADGVTASGFSVWTNGMKLVAADTTVLPFGTLVSIPGYDGGEVVPVLDRGGRIKGMRLDVLYPTHRAARRWGVQDLTVTVWEYADGE